MNLVYRILLKLAGVLLSQYLLPLFNPPLRSALETVLPVARRYVAHYVTRDDLTGAKKKDLASDLIWQELKRLGRADSVTQGDVDTAIQLAYHALELDTNKREMK